MLYFGVVEQLANGIDDIKVSTETQIKTTDVAADGLGSRGYEENLRLLSHHTIASQGARAAVFGCSRTIGKKKGAPADKQ